MFPGPITSLTRISWNNLRFWLLAPMYSLLQRGPIPMIKRTGILLVSTVFMVSTALAQMAPAKTGDTPKGKVLVNDRGTHSTSIKRRAPGRSSRATTARRCGPTRDDRYMLGRMTRRQATPTATGSSMAPGISQRHRRMTVWPAPCCAPDVRIGAICGGFQSVKR